MYLDVRYKIYFLLHCFLLIQITESNRKSKRTRDYKTGLPTYDILSSNKLPSDLQVTTFLYKEQPKIIFYWSTVENGPLSATVTACSSSINWNFSFSENNYTDMVPNKDTFLLSNTVTSGIETKHYKSKQGLYVLNLIAKERDTYVNIYISTEPGGPQALQHARYQTIKLIKKRRRKRLTLKWEPSLVDPQGTYYCLVASTKRNFPSLCNAQSEKFGVNFLSSAKVPVAESQTIINWQPTENTSDVVVDPSIVCIQKRTTYTLNNLQHGQRYYFDVFAVNKQSNLTYSYGSSYLTFNRNIKPITLRDGKSTFANLRKLDGKAVFKFKVNRKAGSALELFIMPCNGAVDVEIYLQGNLVAAKRRILGLGGIRIPSPVPKSRYYIKILATNRNDLRKTSGVEVYATTKSLSKTPIPKMPQEPIVNEYKSLRRCNSVTIGWLPSPGQKSAHYCFLIKEGEIREMENYEMPNQCGLENRLKKSADFALRYCKNISHEKEQVLTEKINQLSPGKHYIVQVTVKKPKGKTLSYNLLQVYTLSACHRKHFLNET